MATAEPEFNLEIATNGSTTEPSYEQKNQGWNIGEKPAPNVMNYLMKGYYEWIEWLNISLVEIITQTVEGTTISAHITNDGTNKIVSGVIDFNTECKSNVSLEFDELPEPQNNNNVVLKNNTFECNFNVGKKLNIIRRNGWEREIDNVGGAVRAVSVYNNEVFILNSSGIVYVTDLQGNALRNFTPIAGNTLTIDVYNDELFVIDITTDLVYVTDLQGNALRNFGGVGTSPLSISVYNDEVFVLDDNLNLVYVTDLDGVAKRNFSAIGTSLFSLCVYNDEVFIVDDGNATIRVTDLNGTSLRSFSGVGTSPSGITVYNDEIFVTDTSSDLVYVTDLDGVAKRNFGNIGALPFDLFVYFNEVFVADNSTSKIYVKKISSDDSDPAASYSIKQRVPFQYLAEST